MSPQENKDQQNGTQQSDKPRSLDVACAVSDFVVFPGQTGEILLPVGGVQLDPGEGFWSLGSCMEPTLMPGDRLRVEKVEGLRKGWIVAFRWGPEILVHRVVRVDGSSFWASGDSNWQIQGPVEPAALIGRVVAFKRDGKWVSIVGRRWEARGWWYGKVIKGLRQLAWEQPELRKWFEGRVLANPVTRRLLKRTLGPLLGQVEITEEPDWQRSVAILGSGDFRLSQELLKRVREGRETGELRVWSARSERLGRIGRMAICKLDEQTALIFSHVLRPLVRGLGIGSRLLKAAEAQARRDGFRRVLRVVSQYNARSLSSGEGYRVVPDDELDEWPAELLQSMRLDHMLLIKNLDRAEDEVSR